jgi:hypothetical protein
MLQKTPVSLRGVKIGAFNNASQLPTHLVGGGFVRAGLPVVFVSHTAKGSSAADSGYAGFAKSAGGADSEIANFA